jgi:hypothetical protein
MVLVRNLVKETGSARVDEGVNEAADAVHEAADAWVVALEALVAAEQASEEVEPEQEAVDIAGSRLVMAVNRWRSNQRRPGRSP